MLNFTAAQTFLRDHQLDAWLLYDFRGSNPVMWHALGMERETTRRSFLIVRQTGDPQWLMHAIEAQLFQNRGIEIVVYRSWQELEQKLAAMLAGCRRVAMEYSPRCAVPTMSVVDAGMFELIRSLGVEICPSADLCATAASQWSDEAYDRHRQAARHVSEMKDAAFNYIRESLRSGAAINECDVQQVIIRQRLERKLGYEGVPIVAVNQNSSSPHYTPQQGKCLPIRKGDWVLIDLAAKWPGESNVFSDITWVAYAGRTPPERHREIFELVKSARDRVIARLAEAWKIGETLRGYQLDMVARSHIESAGYGQYFIHRTGHSLGPGPRIHGNGVNLDNLETRDTRVIGTRIGFSVEPGIYLPEFGVRLETNVFMHPTEGPVITSPLQDEIVLLSDTA